MFVHKLCLRIVFNFSSWLYLFQRKSKKKTLLIFFLFCGGGEGGLVEGVKTRYYIGKVIKWNIYILTSIEQPYSIIESKWSWHNFRERSPPPSSQLHARPPFGHPNQSCPIFVTSIYKWASQFRFILTDDEGKYTAR